MLAAVGVEVTAPRLGDDAAPCGGVEEGSDDRAVPQPDGRGQVDALEELSLPTGHRRTAQDMMSTGRIMAEAARCARRGRVAPDQPDVHFHDIPMTATRALVIIAFLCTAALACFWPRKDDLLTSPTQDVDNHSSAELAEHGSASVLLAEPVSRSNAVGSEPQPLTPARDVRVRRCVVDDSTGRPLAAIVTSSGVVLAFTNPETGIFEANLKTGEAASVTSLGFSPERFVVDAADDTTARQIRLRAHAKRIEVVGADGAPAPNAEVFCLSAHRPGQAPQLAKQIGTVGLDGSLEVALGPGTAVFATDGQIASRFEQITDSPSQSLRLTDTACHLAVQSAEQTPLPDAVLVVETLDSNVPVSLRIPLGASGVSTHPVPEGLVLLSESHGRIGFEQPDVLARRGRPGPHPTFGGRTSESTKLEVALRDALTVITARWYGDAALVLKDAVTGRFVEEVDHWSETQETLEPLRGQWIVTSPVRRTRLSRGRLPMAEFRTLGSRGKSRLRLAPSATESSPSTQSCLRRPAIASSSSSPHLDAI